MSPAELAELCQRQESYGLTKLMLTMPIPKSGLRGYRLRTPFGLAEIANAHDGIVCFWIEINKVRRWLKRALSDQLGAKE